MDWLTEVGRFFDYTELPDNRKVKFVAYRLKRGASLWWDRLREMRMREGRGPIQTWLRMKQLLRDRVCLWTINNIFFMLIIDVHKVARV